MAVMLSVDIRYCELIASAKEARKMNHRKIILPSTANADRNFKNKSPSPRLLNKAQAATYCGMSIGSFSENCRVMPIRVQPGLRGLRYDIEDLNDWIERQKASPDVINPVELIEELGRDKN